MKASEMQSGDMLLILNEIDNSARVWVKVRNDKVQGVDASVFVKNDELVKSQINNTEIPIMAFWAISDRYFDRLVAEELAYPVIDLKDAEAIASGRGFELPLLDW